MKLFTLVFFALALSAQTPVPTSTAAPAPPYQYFGETGLSYDYYGQAPASTTGFGVRIGASNAFSVTDIDTPVGQPNVSYATLRTGIEYHVVVSGNWEFIGIGAVGATTNGTNTTASFGGGVALSYDLGALLSKNKLHLPVALQFRMNAITATQVKPVYGLMFRKTF